MIFAIANATKLGIKSELADDIEYRKVHPHIDVHNLLALAFSASLSVC